MTILKPFLMLACVAFVVGFMGYLAAFQILAGPAPAVTADSGWSAPASAPVTDDWNFGKKI